MPEFYYIQDKISGKFVGSKTQQHIGLYDTYDHKVGCLSGTPVLFQRITTGLQALLDKHKWFVKKSVIIGDLYD